MSIFNRFTKKKTTPKAKPTVQYSKPIGPTKPSSSSRSSGTSLDSGGRPVSVSTSSPFKSSGGGGGSSGGGSYQGPVPQGSNVQTFRTTGTTIPTKTSGSSAPTYVPPPTSNVVQQTPVVIKGGSVRIGKFTYSGRAIVPGTGGMTANQYGRKITDEAVARGDVEQKDRGRVTFRGSVNKTEQKEFNFEETPSTDFDNLSSVIRPVNPLNLVYGIGRDVSQPAPRVNVDLFRKAGRELFFIDGTPIDAVGTLVSPAQRFFPKKEGDIEFKEPQFGTIQDLNVAAYGTGAGKTTTGFQIQREQALMDFSLLAPAEVKAQQISSDVSSQLQQQIYSGELTQEKAEQLFLQQINKRQPELEKVISFKNKLNIYSQPFFDVSKTAETAAFIGASTTPLGKVVLAGPSSVSSGLGNIFEGETKTQKLVGGLQVGFGLEIGASSFMQAQKQVDEILLLLVHLVLESYKQN